MKIAISVPDDLYSLIDMRAHELGLNRSQFFRVSAEHYLHELETQSITGRLDAAITRGVVDSEASDFAAFSKRGLAADVSREGDEW